MLNRFRRLMEDLDRETVTRNTFQRWEIDLLLDLEACRVRPSTRREILRQYRRAVERQFEQGADAPLKLSEFLAQRQTRPSRP